RADDHALARALDDAMGGLVARGGLRAILALYWLDGPREAGLASAMATAPPPALAPSSRLGSHQLLLFLDGALVTPAISAAAMALAVVLGLALALARHAMPRLGRLATI